MIGCYAHKGSVGQGLRSKPAANGAQIVPRSSHFLSQIYAQGGEGRGQACREGWRRAEGCGLSLETTAGVALQLQPAKPPASASIQLVKLDKKDRMGLGWGIRLGEH